MKNKLLDLMIVIVLALAALLLAFTGLQSALVRLFVMAPLVFFLPGYALTHLVFTSEQLDGWERILMSLGISLMVTIITGIILNQTPAGLQTTSWSIALASITLIAAVFALLKRRVMQAKKTPHLENRFRVMPAILITSAVILTAGAYFFARTTTNSLSHSFTSLWITPVDKNQPNVLQVGVTNMENSTVNYRLTVQAGGKVLEQFPSIPLQSGKTWNSQVNISGVTTASGPVTADLYRLDSPSKIYRTATWWPASP
ncbi:MAG: DUF1616 domain-containing protein [Omnitrophica WOR_2 bacterium]